MSKFKVGDTVILKSLYFEDSISLNQLINHKGVIAHIGRDSLLEGFWYKVIFDNEPTLHKNIYEANLELIVSQDKKTSISTLEMLSLITKDNTLEFKNENEQQIKWQDTMLKWSSCDKPVIVSDIFLKEQWTLITVEPMSFEEAYIFYKNCNVSKRQGIKSLVTGKVFMYALIDATDEEVRGKWVKI